MSRQDKYYNLFQQHGDMVFRYCALHTHNIQDAQDIYQEVFLKLFKKQPHFHDDMHAKAWLLRVSVNLCKNYHRSGILHPTHTFDDSIHVPISKSIKEPQILQHMRKIPKKYSRVLYLYYFEGYSQKEISMLLGCKESTIRSWMLRGKKQLQDVIKKEDTFERCISRV